MLEPEPRPLVGGPAQAPDLRRRHARTRVKWQATWQSPDGSFQTAEILDLSPDGAFVRPLGTFVPKPSDRLRVWLRTAESEPLEFSAACHVRWQGPSGHHGCSGFGIRFDRIHADIQSWLERHDWGGDTEIYMP